MIGKSNTISFRRLLTLDEMREAVEVQQVFWGSDLESVVPAHMLFSMATYGGHVLAAFDGERMIGVLIGFLGASNPDEPAANSLQVVSKRMVVLPEYRGQGVGNQLKLEQRQLAIEQGMSLVTWTFDPLLALNAHLNIRKLGAISQTYLTNYYGTEEGGGLTTLGFSDRLYAEWWVKHPHVCERFEGNYNERRLTDYLAKGATLIPAGVNAADFVTPQVSTAIANGVPVLLEIPTQYGEIVRADPELARAWRLVTRNLFQRLFGLKYVVMDFLHEEYEGRKRACFVFTQVDVPFRHEINSLKAV